MSSEEVSNNGCLVVIALWIIVALFVILIPVSYWLVLSASLTLALAIIQEALQEELQSSDEQDISKFALASAGIIKALYETSINILVGLCFVGLCQLLLQGVGHFAEESTISRSQQFLVDVTDALKKYFGFYYILAAIVVVITLSVVLKQSSILHKFLSFKDSAGRLIVGMTVVTSFSFFSASAVSDYQKEWKAVVSKEIDQRLSTIEKQENKLLAEAVVKNELLTQNTAQNTELVQVFYAAVKQPHAKRIVIRVAKESIKACIVESDLLPLIYFPDSSRFDELRKRFNETQSMSAGDSQALTLRELKELNNEASEREKIVTASADAGLEVIKTGLTSFLPEDAHFMISPFLETLVEGLAEKGFSKLQFVSIQTLNDAIYFVRAHVKNNIFRIKDIIAHKENAITLDESIDSMVSRMNSELEKDNSKKIEREIQTETHRASNGGYSNRIESTYRPHISARR